MIDYSDLLLTLHIEEFKCPFCGTTHTVDEAVVEELTGEVIDKRTHAHGRVIEQRETKRVYHVRLCPSCAKKRKLIRKIIPIVTHIAIPIGVGIYKAIETGSVGTFLWSFFLIQIIMLWVTALLYFIMLPSPDFEKAAEDNALANPFSFL